MIRPEGWQMRTARRRASLILWLAVVAVPGVSSGQDETSREPNPGPKNQRGKPQLRISVETGKPTYEVNERTHHTLKITNQSSKTVAIPSFRFLNVKQEDPEIAFYLKERILQIQVTCGTNTVPTNEGWQAASERPRPFPLIELEPGKSVSEPFSLTRRWYPAFFSLKGPGMYTVAVTLDTTGVKNDRILKGRFASAPVPFRIVAVPTFRKKGPQESQSDYAIAKVVFYLKRIEHRQGEYFPNVWNILNTQDAVPGLIRTIELSDENTAAHAQTILGQIHHRSDNSDTRELPNSMKDWEEWWRNEGVNLGLKELWSRFDSHYP